MYTLIDCLQGFDISRADTRIEIEDNHGCDFSEFVAEFGDHDTYNSRDIVLWLGY